MGVDGVWEAHRARGLGRIGMDVGALHWTIAEFTYEIRAKSHSTVTLE